MLRDQIIQWQFAVIVFLALACVLLGGVAYFAIRTLRELEAVVQADFARMRGIRPTQEISDANR